MALCALCIDVRSRQRKASIVVVERCARPRRCAVAGLTRLRESRLHVVRVRSPLEIFEVTGHASSVRQVVIAVDMALRALCVDVRSRQRKAGLAVIEGRVAPRHGVVARRTSRRHPSLRVIRIRRALVILHVTGRAIGRSACELSVHMALCASNVYVSTGKRELGKRIVIEVSGRPRGSVMATLAGLRKTGLRVVGVGRFLKIGQVAAHAGCRRPGKFSSDVACHAVKGAVCSG